MIPLRAGRRPTQVVFIGALLVAGCADRLQRAPVVGLRPFAAEHLPWFQLRLPWRHALVGAFGGAHAGVRRLPPGPFHLPGILIIIGCLLQLPHVAGSERVLISPIVWYRRISSNSIIPPWLLSSLVS